MKKILGCLGFVLLLISPTYSQINTEDNYVQAVGYWKKGDAYTFNVSTLKRKIQNDQEETVQDIAFKVKIAIEDVTSSGYEVSWTYFDYSSSNSTSPEFELIEAISENIKIVLAMTTFGELVEISNWQEVAATVSVALNILKNQKDSSQIFLSYVDMIIQKIGTKEGLESLFFKDIQQYYSFHGSRFEIGKEYTQHSQYPDPFGNGSLEKTTNVYVSPDDILENNFVVESQSTIEGRTASDGLIESLVQSGSISSSQIEEARKFGFTVSHTVKNQIHGPSGWVVVSSQVRRTKVNNVETVDMRTIELQD